MHVAKRWETQTSFVFWSSLSVICFWSCSCDLSSNCTSSFPSLILFSLSFCWKPTWYSVSMLASSIAPSSFFHKRFAWLSCHWLCSVHCEPLVKYTDAYFWIRYCCKHKGSVGKRLTAHLGFDPDFLCLNISCAVTWPLCLFAHKKEIVVVWHWRTL